MSFICNKCKCESNRKSQTDAVCASCSEDLELLNKQLETNSTRIKRLEDHKKSTESELNNLNSESNRETLLETMKRIERNLQIEYRQHQGIINAIKTKWEF